MPKRAANAFFDEFGLVQEVSGSVFENPDKPSLQQAFTIVGPVSKDADKTIQALSFRQFYKFSNALIALSNAVFLASKLGATRIHFPKPSQKADYVAVYDLIFGERTDIMLENGIVLCRSDPDPSQTTLVGGFFYSRHKSLYHERPSHAHQIERIAPFLAIGPVSNAFGADEPVIHIRSGDIFKPGATVHPGYGQPPLAYYMAVLASINPKRVHVVFQDRLNPVIDRLLNFLNEKQINFEIYSCSLRDDITVLLRANVVIAGIGTFVPGVMWLSKNVKRVYYFGRLPINSADNRFETRIVSDAGDYVQRVMDGNWINSVEQRQLMLDYPEENIRV